MESSLAGWLVSLQLSCQWAAAQPGLEEPLPSSLTWLLPGLRRLASKFTHMLLTGFIPCHMGFSTSCLRHCMAVDDPKRGKKGRECPKWKSQSVYNLILVMRSNYFCYALFVRNESVSPTHSQEEGIDCMRARIQDMGMICGHLRECLPHFLSFRLALWRLRNKVLTEVLQSKCVPHPDSYVGAQYSMQ